MKRILLAAVCIGNSWAPPLWAHHQLGLPHYLYSEDYPQIPTMEIEAVGEGHTVLFTTMPGNPNPGQEIRLKVYIRNDLTGQAYTRPITVSVSCAQFFGPERVLMAPSAIDADFNTYRLNWIFHEAEKYFVNVTFEPRPNFHETIKFPLVVGDTSPNNFILAGAGAVFLGAFVGVGLIRKRRSATQIGCVS